MVNYDQLSEEEVLIKLAENDREAAKYIYDKYAPAIYGIILQENDYKKGCEEILIRTFISFFKEACKKPSLLPNCIFIKLHNIALWQLRQNKGSQTTHTSLENNRY